MRDILQELDGVQLLIARQHFPRKGAERRRVQLLMRNEKSIDRGQHGLVLVKPARDTRISLMSRLLETVLQTAVLPAPPLGQYPQTAEQPERAKQKPLATFEFTQDPPRIHMTS
nr:hypothetical protein [Chromobacterium amazonense]